MMHYQMKKVDKIKKKGRMQENKHIILFVKKNYTNT